MPPPTTLAQPAVDVHCVVCASAAHTVVCSTAEIQHHDRYLHHFHSRRLRRTPTGALPSSALLERAQFTQDYMPRILSSARTVTCSFAVRVPRAQRSSAPIRKTTMAYNGLPRCFTVNCPSIRQKRRRSAAGCP